MVFRQKTIEIFTTSRMILILNAPVSGSKLDENRQFYDANIIKSIYRLTFSNLLFISKLKSFSLFIFVRKKKLKKYFWINTLSHNLNVFKPTCYSLTGMSIKKKKRLRIHSNTLRPTYYTFILKDFDRNHSSLRKELHY